MDQNPVVNTIQKQLDKLSKLNPLNHLAGKIFLYFWLMIILTLSLLFLISAHINFRDDDRPIPPRITKQIANIQRALTLPKSNNYQTTEQLMMWVISKVSRKSRLARESTFIYGSLNQPLISNRPLPKDLDINSLDTSISSPSTYISPHYHIYGPFQLKANNTEQQLFMLTKLRDQPNARFKYLPWWMQLGIPLTISAILSFLVARRLVKPIQILCSSHHSLAQGDLKTNSAGVANRQDELGQLGRDFEHMVEKITQLLAAQKRLLGDVSHELRSPLARLQVALGLAHTAANQDLPRHLERIELETQRLDDMIGDVLHLSRLENQLHHIEKHRICLTNLLEELSQDANFEAQHQHKQVTLHLEKDRYVLGDQGLLASAFENVIRNGLKYTEPHSEVHIDLRSDGEMAIVSIRDQGPGVPTSALPQLFQPFYRVSDSRQRGSGGTGLGLAIAEKSIHAHGGKIHAFNLAEKGLNVVIKLPIQPTIQPRIQPNLAD